MSEGDRNQDAQDDSPQAKDKYPTEPLADFLGISEVNPLFLWGSGVLLSGAYLVSLRNNEDISAVAGVILIFYWIIALTALAIRWGSRGK